MRTVVRRAAAVGASVAFVAAVAVTPAVAAPASSAASTPGLYLALGDSVAFGYVPSNAVPAPDYSDAASFVGYPEDLGTSLGLKVVNASCPGETTISMIAAGGQSNGCENAPGSSVGYRTFFPLHVSYSGTQLAFAEQFLKSHPTTSLVTINIGANDAFVCQETTADHCTSPAELAGVLNDIYHNLKAIYTGIRQVGGYHGTLVALSYYSLNYNNTKLDEQTTALDDTITTVTRDYGGYVANGYTAFYNASAPSHNSCTAGLIIPIPHSPCNVHPTSAGHLVLAAAIAKVVTKHPTAP
jgi:lysophospholipase L1-like esterase